MSAGYGERRTVSWFKCVVMCIIVAIVAGITVGVCITQKYETEAESSGNSGNQIVSNMSFQDDGTGTDVSKAVSPSVVFISNIVSSDSLYGGYGEYFGYNFGYNSGSGTDEDIVNGTGSGVIYSSDGYIVTNNHVVDGADKVTVKLYDGSEYVAEVIGTDSQTDLAVIKIDASDLVAADFADSDQIVVGEVAIAIGNPGGADFVNSVTKGIISGLNRNVEVSEGQYMTLIQTDAAINPGNSGGALCNGNGQVIGINTVKISQTGFEGMGFAIPANNVKDICDQLISGGKVSRPALQVGIYGDITAEIAEYYDLKVDYGVLVQPAKGGAAEKAGMEDEDIIIAIDGNKVETTAQLQKYLYEKKIGDKVEVTVDRNGKEINFDVTLGELE